MIRLYTRNRSIGFLRTSATGRLYSIGKLPHKQTHLSTIVQCLRGRKASNLFSHSCCLYVFVFPFNVGHRPYSTFVCWQNQLWGLFARHTTMTLIILYLVYSQVSTVVRALQIRALLSPLWPRLFVWIIPTC